MPYHRKYGYLPCGSEHLFVRAIVSATGNGSRDKGVGQWEKLRFTSEAQAIEQTGGGFAQKALGSNAEDVLNGTRHPRSLERLAGSPGNAGTAAWVPKPRVGKLGYPYTRISVSHRHNWYEAPAGIFTQINPGDRTRMPA